MMKLFFNSLMLAALLLSNLATAKVTITQEKGKTIYQFQIEEVSVQQDNKYINLFKTGAKVKINNIDTVVELVVGNEGFPSGTFTKESDRAQKFNQVKTKDIGFKNVADGSKYTIASFLIPEPGDSKTLTIKFLK